MVLSFLLVFSDLGDGLKPDDYYALPSLTLIFTRQLPHLTSCISFKANCFSTELEPRLGVYTLS